MTEALKTIISSLPESPGIYQYFDREGTIIYIGKAKNLKRRVNSYFNKTHDSPKTSILVRKIEHIKYIVVPTEEDALHLENNLIKQHQPRYNVMLKDDKSYPWLVIRRESFPRVQYIRNRTKDKSLYFGPYSNPYAAKLIKEFIHELYPLRTCNLLLTPDKIEKGGYKPCLEFHIKRCKAPCVGWQGEEEYNQNIADVRKILKGESHEVHKHLLERMQQLSTELRFEEAQEIKKKYDLLDAFRSKSVVVNPTINDVDVVGYEDNEKSAFINFLHIVQGCIVQGYTFEYKKVLDETREELLGLGIVEIRQRFGLLTKEIIVPFLPETELSGVNYTIPIKGDKKRLLELSLQNVRQYKLDKLKQAEKLNPEQRVTRVLTRLKTDLQLDELPMHIECFDNSNTQGTNPVAACVVFKKAKPAKSDYRHFNIKTVVGPDDFASMREIITRRYGRLVEEGQPLPHLIVIDGGKGQLHAAVEALQSLGLYRKIAIIGIAKKLEEIYFPEDPIPLYLDKNSESLRIIQHLRDEAHRFGITFHRQKRSKGQTLSQLDSIEGIGEKTREKLLKSFKSMKRIKEATLAELIELLGEKKGEVFFEAIHKEASPPAHSSREGTEA